MNNYKNEILNKISSLSLKDKGTGLLNMGPALIEYMKKGSKIHIKKENRGKFTASAKRAGESVQEHAHKIMNDPNATPLQRRRANFAIQAKRWHRK